jgi:hypothetical protein
VSPAEAEGRRASLSGLVSSNNPYDLRSDHANWLLWDTGWHTEANGMNQNQYRTALERLGLTQDSAAEFLGVSLRTSHGYANGSPIPEGTAKLLRLMVRLNLSPPEVR